jgi:hypothetical protein
MHYHRVSCDVQLPDDVITIGAGIRKDYGRNAGKRAQCDIEPEQRPSSAAADHPATVCATLQACIYEISLSGQKNGPHQIG